MQQGSQYWRDDQETPRQSEKTIQEWESQYPGTWILLEITQEDEGEPVRGLLIATADDPEDLQDIWKSYRVKGVLTMLTYGRLVSPFQRWWRVPRNWVSFPPHRLPVIALRVRDTIVRALADTGASQSLIDPHLIKQLGIEATDTGLIVGIGTNPLRVPFVTLDGVVIGRCSL